METLETRNRDRLDFHEVAVRSLEDALTSAFREFSWGMHPKKKTLKDLAKKHFDISTLTPAHSDRLDFHDLSVWSINSALEEMMSYAKTDPKKYGKKWKSKKNTDFFEKAWIKKYDHFDYSQYGKMWDAKYQLKPEKRSKAPWYSEVLEEWRKVQDNERMLKDARAMTKEQYINAYSVEQIDHYKAPHDVLHISDLNIWEYNSIEDMLWELWPKVQKWWDHVWPDVFKEYYPILIENFKSASNEVQDWHHRLTQLLRNWEKDIPVRYTNQELWKQWEKYQKQPKYQLRENPIPKMKEKDTTQIDRFIEDKMKLDTWSRFTIGGKVAGIQNYLMHNYPHHKAYITKKIWDLIQKHDIREDFSKEKEASKKIRLKQSKKWRDKYDTGNPSDTLMSLTPTDDELLHPTTILDYQTYAWFLKSDIAEYYEKFFKNLSRVKNFNQLEVLNDLEIARKYNLITKSFLKVITNSIKKT